VIDEAGRPESKVDPVPTTRLSAELDDPDLGRLPVCVRIGVTGHRRLGSIDSLRGGVDRAIDDALLAASAGVDSVPTVVSALADGADRLVAERVLARTRGRLEVVLPMEPEVYEATFLDRRASPSSSSDYSSGRRPSRSLPRLRAKRPMRSLPPGPPWSRGRTWWSPFGTGSKRRAKVGPEM
jgi:hypothetical protein